MRQVIAALNRGLNARLLQTALLLCGLYFGASASWIHIKAELAQLLIQHAWQKTLASPEQKITPWAWADTRPVARLQLPNKKMLMVLDGAQGNSLAFGPGLVAGSDTLGQGFSVIGGHRDTHFAALENAKPGQRLAVQTHHGDWIAYRITDVRVIDIHQTALEKQATEGLILVTCYPFHTIESDPNKRWVVTSERINF
ncbi:hypothetical protein R50072_25460 [Simiduia litorea]|uniref:class GN sortase n=1 Tax=Simiduia litorea TaxID=1435348 RepID=UPI0036F21E92